jgi:hypothetical protein
MKIALLAWLILLGTNGLAQVDTKKTIHFTDSTGSPLSFLANRFYDRAEGLDTCCLFAIGSAKFTIRKNHKIDQVEVSLGIPTDIAARLKEVIISSAAYWTLDPPTKSVTVIIPLIVTPSSLCDQANRKDDSFASTANMLLYEGTYDRVLRSDYYKKATGSEFGLVLSPLLIRGPTNDIYKDRPYKN